VVGGGGFAATGALIVAAGAVVVGMMGAMGAAVIDAPFPPELEPFLPPVEEVAATAGGDE